MDPAAALDENIMSSMRTVHEAERKGDSEIQQLFKGSVVFITGGTGFLGKQLVEKLLRACHGIKKIYLLTRNKKGETTKERLAHVFQNPLFDQLRKLNPDFEKLVTPVEGDITEKKLGIKDEDWKTLTDEVNFIYHVAATVLFNESLKSAITANVRGTREAITLARECRNLKSMVYVSTAYLHCNRKEVLEMFYPSPVPPAAIIEMVESMEESRLDAMTPALTKGWPNTYTFSKAIAEETVRVMGKGLPICIVRPGIVTATYREPVPGWLDSSQALGPSGIYLGISLGLIRILLVKKETLFDTVPVDYVNNLTIASSWETAYGFQRGEDDIKIYTCSMIRNRMSWAYFQSIVENYVQRYRTPKAVWYTGAISTSNKKFYLFLTVLLHFIPAIFIDGILIIMGKKFRVGKLYRNAYKLNTALSFFLLNTWDFKDDNTLGLSRKLTKADQEIFHFDVADIEIKRNLVIWWLGMRKYIIKDGLQGTEKALKREPYMRIAHYVVSILYFSFSWKVLSRTLAIVSYYFACIFKLSTRINKFLV